MNPSRAAGVRVSALTNVIRVDALPPVAAGSDSVVRDSVDSGRPQTSTVAIWRIGQVQGMKHEATLYRFQGWHLAFTVLTLKPFGGRVTA